MTRSFYFASGLLAMALIVLAFGVDRLPAYRPSAAAHTSVSPMPVASDPVARAVDDLAAWPIAAQP